MKENYIAQNKEILHKTAQIQRILHYNDEIGPRTKMEASLPFQKSSGLPALLDRQTFCTIDPLWFSVTPHRPPMGSLTPHRPPMGSLMPHRPPSS
ncbi:hypothetical protein T11_11036 [Trichinella zimbabwensis]|uniref:Uncharacterized protein n=1 Tax=Trichinella zimbabwensis TaxID=268475 RepID=A0A0V1GPG2_9BILA|nr:hypothetical protein T11_11036 [Trichinella zimbabwensis]